jgi:hypothetical protein
MENSFKAFSSFFKPIELECGYKIIHDVPNVTVSLIRLLSVYDEEIGSLHKVQSLRT